jgi:hypothetical protein
MHRNWDLTAVLAPPRQPGIKGLTKRIAHRLVMAALAPYLARLQEYLAVSLRALDVVARRSDEDFTAQQNLMDAIRSDVVDFAHHVDERNG